MTNLNIKIISNSTNLILIEKLKKFYNERTKENSKLNVIEASQKAGKAIIPAWIVSDWIKKYRMNR